MSDTAPNSPAILTPFPPPRAHCRSWIYTNTGPAKAPRLSCWIGPNGPDPENVAPHLEGRRNLQGLIMPAVLPPLNDYESSNPSDEVLSSALRVTDAVLAVCGIGAPAPAPAPAPDAIAGLPEP